MPAFPQPDAAVTDVRHGVPKRRFSMGSRLQCRPRGDSHPIPSTPSPPYRASDREDDDAFPYTNSLLSLNSPQQFPALQQALLALSGRLPNLSLRIIKGFIRAQALVAQHRLSWHLIFPPSDAEENEQTPPLLNTKNVTSRNWTIVVSRSIVLKKHRQTTHKLLKTNCC